MPTPVRARLLRSPRAAAPPKSPAAPAQGGVGAPSHVQSEEARCRRWKPSEASKNTEVTLRGSANENLIEIGKACAHDDLFRFRSLRAHAPFDHFSRGLADADIRLVLRHGEPLVASLPRCRRGSHDLRLPGGGSKSVTRGRAFDRHGSMPFRRPGALRCPTHGNALRRVRCRR